MERLSLEMIEQIGNVHVKKIGGTSVDRLPDVLNLVDQERSEARQVLVVSAFSGETDELIGGKKVETGAFKEIIKARDRIGSGIDQLALNPITQPRIGHALQMARQVMPEAYLGEKPSDVLHQQKDDAFVKFLDLLRKPNLSPGEKLFIEDVVMALGERFGAAMVVEGGNYRGNQEYRLLDFSGALPVPGNLDAALTQPPTKIQVYSQIIPVMAQGLAQAFKDNVIPVIPGHFGFIPGGLLNLFKRSYSEATTALAVATLLQMGISPEQIRADVIKDVAALLAADPRVVQNPVAIERLTSEELGEITEVTGTQALHPDFTAILAGQDVPVWIRSIKNPNDQGTKIQKSAPDEKLPEGIFYIGKKAQRIIKISWKSPDRPGIVAELGSIFNQFGISINALSAAGKSITLTVDTNAPNQEELLRYFDDLEETSVIGAKVKKYEVTEKTGEFTMFSFVGRGMESKVGLLRQILQYLEELGIPIEVDNGDPDINITLTVPTKNADETLRHLYKALSESGLLVKSGSLKVQ